MDDPSQERNAQSNRRRKLKPKTGFPVVGLGASAGGLQALKRFFEGMPAESGMAFVVIMHLSPEHESHAAAILQNTTRMSVTQVNEQVKVEPNHVYVIPPTKHLAMEDGHIRLSEPTRPTGRHVAVDLFFRTLADTHQTRAVCIVLSGTGADGSVGVKRVKEAGGLAIAQDPQDAEYDAMPRNAINTGMIDFVLPVVEMPEKLIELWRNMQRIQLPAEAEAPVVDESQATENALLDVLGDVRAHTGHDFTHYKRATILRRIERRMQVNAVPDLPAYRNYLRATPVEAQLLLKDLLIGVTNFFRDRAAFDSFEREVVPLLFGGKTTGDVVRVWCAGCATGEEAYSVAMLLLEQAARMPQPPDIQIFATDIDEEAIQTARVGSYSEAIEADVPPTRLRQFFTKEPGGYRVNKEVRERILFAAHNLIKDPPFSKLDAVTCRNLLIYLNRDVQEQVFELFHFALLPGGFIFLGPSESVDGAPDLFAPVSKKHRLFRAQVVARQARGIPSLPLKAPARKTRGGAAGVSSIDAAERRRIAFGELHQQFVEQYAPPSLIVNAEYEIVHLSENVGRFLRRAGGEPSVNVVKEVLPELRLELRTALFQAMQTGRSTEARRVSLELEGHRVYVNMIVRPSRATEGETSYALVLFVETEEALGEEGKESPDGKQDALVSGLEEEAQRLKDQLQATIEQYETTVEELKSSNEEMQSVNEEVRSTSEELETSKEELQSVNEELRTVNQELKNKVEEVSDANADLKNLIASTEIATVFLDRSLRIKRYTPRATEIFSLIPTDLGRPLADITHRLEYENLHRDAEEVIANLSKIEREVRAADKRFLIARFSPYRTLEDRIGGVVISFIDVTEREEAAQLVREERAYAEAIVETVREPLIVLDQDLRVVSASRSFYETFRVAPEETEKEFIYNLGNRQWDIPALRELLEDILPQKSQFQDFEVEHNFETIGRRTMLLNAREIRRGDGARRLILLAISDISERKRAAEALRESEQRLQRMVNVPRVGVLTFDYAGAMLHANDAFLEMVGYDREEFAAKKFTWRDFTPSEYVEASMAIMEQLRETGRGGPYEKEYFRKDGSRMWLMFVAADLGDGTIAEYTVDITDRKRIEEALHENEERLNDALRAAEMGSWRANLATGLGTRDANLNRILGHEAVETTQAIDDCFRLIHPDDKAAVVAAWQRAIDTRGIYETEFRLVREDGSKCWLREQGRFVAGEGGKADFVTGLTTDITERKEAEERLRESEERFRALIDKGVDVITISDPAGSITYASPSIEAMSGYTVEEFTKQHPFSTIHPEDLPQCEAALKHLVNQPGESVFLQHRYRHKSGEWRWLEGTFTSLFHDPAVGGLVANFRDVTERKLAEENLNASAERLRTIFETSRDGILVEEGERIIYVNQAYARLFGYDAAEELIGKHVSAVISLEDTERLLEFGRSRVHGKLPSSFYEFRGKRKDGTLIEVEASVSASTVAGRNLITTTIRDITERKRIETLFRAQKQALEMVVVGSPLDEVLKYLAGIVERQSAGSSIASILLLDEQGRLHNGASPSLPEDYIQAIEGIAADESVGTCSRAAAISEIVITPDIAADPKWQDLKHLPLGLGLRAAWSMPMVAPDGRVLGTFGTYFREKREPTEFERQTVEILVGTAALAIERKQAEVRLRESEMRFRAAFEQANVGIVQASADGRLLLVNPGFCKIVGYPEEEARGMMIRDITHADDYEKEEELTRRLVAGEISGYSLEKRFLRKDGVVIWGQMTATLVRRESGEPYYLLSIVEDISERKRAEGALKQLNEELEGRVAERTVELMEMNANLQTEIAERKRGEQERAVILRRLVMAQEEERRRIARDMHDQFGQQLTALLLKLGMLKEDCRGREELCGQVESLESVARQLDRDVDFLVWELRPTVLDDLGLREALANFAQNWSEHFGVPVEVHTSGMGRERLTSESETTLYRIAQEALNNVSKHARAESVSILLEQRTDFISLIVEDDGVGFDAEEMFDANDKGLGLVGMRERAALVGGTAKIESRLGEGTTVIVRIPAPPVPMSGGPHE